MVGRRRRSKERCAAGKRDVCRCLHTNSVRSNSRLGELGNLPKRNGAFETSITRCSTNDAFRSRYLPVAPIIFRRYDANPNGGSLSTCENRRKLASDGTRVCCGRPRSLAAHIPAASLSTSFQFFHGHYRSTQLGNSQDYSVLRALVSGEPLAHPSVQQLTRSFASPAARVGTYLKGTSSSRACGGSPLLRFCCRLCHRCSGHLHA